MDYKICTTHENPDLWYSERKREQREAIELCAMCPFQLKCRELGKAEEYGIWGGVLSEPQALATSEKKQRIKERRELVHKYTEQGLSARQIAELVGVSARRVQVDRAALRAAA